MGNSATCLGPQTELMATFPAFSSISSTQTLERDALAVQSTLANFVSLPLSFTPAGGPFLVYLLTFLGSTDFSDLNAAFVKAKISETILENDIHHYNAEINSIKNSLERLNRTDLSPLQIQPDIIYALRRAEYLYDLFKNRNHLLYKYPLVSMPHFIRVLNIFWSTAQISSKLDDTLKQRNDAIIAQLPQLIKSFVDRFLTKRLEGVSWVNCGLTLFSHQCLIYDRPWLKDPSSVNNYFLTAYQFNLPLNMKEWRDGIVIRTPDGCKPEKRDYPNLGKYKDEAEYKSRLQGQYEYYFRKVFPVRF